MAKAIESNSVKELLSNIKELEGEHIPNLLTSVCGWTSILSLLYMTEHDKDIHIHKVDYQNSGDISNGDKNKVVGYLAMAVEKKQRLKVPDDFVLEEKDRKQLLQLARSTITQYVKDKTIYGLSEFHDTKTLNQKAGAFVSLYINKELRGCIGTFNPTGKLISTVQEMAISAATNDYRFSPVKTSELKDIEIEISVLTPLKRINSIDEISLGKHGIYIIKGSSTGTLLPQVPDKYNWTVEEFLGYCSRDKAGIGWEGWKTAEVYTYEAIVFSEKEFKE